MPGGNTRKRERPADPTTVVLADTCTRLQVKNRVLERLIHLFSDLGNRTMIQDEILNAALDAIPAEAASLLVVNPATGDMTFEAARGAVAERIKGLILESGRGIAGACALEKKTLAISDVAHDPRYSDEISRSLGFTTRSLLATPLVWKGETIGVIEVVNKKSGDSFPRHEIELMERIARSAATLLHLSGGRP